MTSNGTCGSGQIARLLTTAMFAASCLTGACIATGQASDDSSEVPLAHLSAQWWQRASSIPVSTNPLADTTGELCMVGDSGPIWFLYGTAFGGSAVRLCSVPADRALFFPVFNFVDVNTPNICGQGAGNLSVADLRAVLAPFIDAATLISVTVDGVSANRHIHRVKSVPFSIEFPADNIFVVPCGGASQSPGGVVFSPAVDDGYYAYLRPMQPGTHTIHIQANAPALTSPLDVTYYLTIVPVTLE